MRAPKLPDAPNTSQNLNTAKLGPSSLNAQYNMSHHSTTKHVGQAKNPKHQLTCSVVSSARSIAAGQTPTTLSAHTCKFKTVRIRSNPLPTRDPIEATETPQPPKKKKFPCEGPRMERSADQRYRLGRAILARRGKYQGSLAHLGAMGERARDQEVGSGRCGAKRSERDGREEKRLEMSQRRVAESLMDVGPTSIRTYTATWKEVSCSAVLSLPPSIYPVA